jgi:hypothetical protein
MDQQLLQTHFYRGGVVGGGGIMDYNRAAAAENE